MIYTYDACNYTFRADGVLPSSCPDCGKSSINRKINNKYISAPAVRKATDEEIAWYEDIQKELVAEEQSLHNMQSLADREGLSTDEYIWL